MWWLLTQHGKQWFQMSLIDQQVQLRNLAPLLKSKNIRGLYEGHHFILMAMEVHGTLRCDMNHFIRECACLFHDRQLKGHLSLFFCIRFFNQCVNIAFQHALASTIKKKRLH
jgi:hypothetical protein